MEFIKVGNVEAQLNRSGEILLTLDVMQGLFRRLQIRSSQVTGTLEVSPARRDKFYCPVHIGKELNHVFSFMAEALLGTARIT